MHTGLIQVLSSIDTLDTCAVWICNLLLIYLICIISPTLSANSRIIYRWRILIVLVYTKILLKIHGMVMFKTRNIIGSLLWVRGCFFMCPFDDEIIGLVLYSKDKYSALWIYATFGTLVDLGRGFSPESGKCTFWQLLLII